MCLLTKAEDYIKPPAHAIVRLFNMCFDTYSAVIYRDLGDDNYKHRVSHLYSPLFSNWNIVQHSNLDFVSIAKIEVLSILQ